jgi:hypothetical protein
VSSCRRIDALLGAFAVVSLGGCMKIYPDPELPDIEVRWRVEDCRPGSGDVLLELTGIDTPTFVAEKRVPCTDGQAAFVDLPRERFRVDGALLTTDGAELTTYWDESDLRHGLDDRIDMWFLAFANLRINWTFSMDASCASLGVDRFEIEMTSEIFPEPAAFEVVCTETPYFVGMPGGTYELGASAYAGEAIVAVAEPVTDVEIVDEGFTIVDLVLAPCGSACP